MAGKKTVFLDRDGTMNVEVNYLHRPEDLVLISGVSKAVALLNQAGYQVVVVTNQAGVARGYYDEAAVDELHAYLNEVLKKEAGAKVDRFYYCPHHPEHGIGAYKVACHCRKPEIGMFEQAEADTEGGIDKAHSYMIGDKLIDTLAGRRFGLTSILVGTGYGKELSEKKEDYDYYAETLLDAVEAILAGNCKPNTSK